MTQPSQVAPSSCSHCSTCKWPSHAAHMHASAPPCMPCSLAHCSTSIWPSLAAQLTMFVSKILSNLWIFVDIHSHTDYPAFCIVHYTKHQKKLNKFHFFPPLQYLNESPSGTYCCEAPIELIWFLVVNKVQELQISSGHSILQHFSAVPIKLIWMC